MNFGDFGLSTWGLFSDSWGPQGVLWAPSWCRGAQDSAQPMKVLLQSSSNLARMGWHPLARPEWKNSRGGDGVTAVPACLYMSLVQSTLMCIPERAAHRYRVALCFWFPVTRACNKIPAPHSHQVIFLGCVRVVLVLPQMCSVCCGQAARGPKPLSCL